MISIRSVALQLLTFASDPMDIEERLEAWGAYWRWRQEQGQAQSFEGGYRSPQHWDFMLTHVPAELDIDRQDVDSIEAAVSALDLFNHVLLKAWYVRKFDPDRSMAAARTAGRRRTRAQFPLYLTESKVLLLAELETPAVVRKQRASEYVRELLGLDPLTFAQKVG